MFGVVLAVTASLLLARWATLNRPGAPLLDPTPLTSDLGSESSPSFSPDGNQVVYEWDGPAQNHWDIYVKGVGADTPLRLTDNAAPSVGPAWSPDGRAVAFRRFFDKDKTEILTIPPAGGRERIVSDDPRTCGPLAWSADSRWIVTSYCEKPPGPAELVALDAANGAMHRLTTPPRENWGDSDPAPSPDGASIVFSRDLGSTSELYRQKLSPEFRPVGDPEPMTAHHRWTGMPAFTPHGEAVVYSSGIKDDVANLWVLPLSPAGPARPLLPSANSNYQPAISRRHNRLAFATGRIFRVDTWRQDVSPDFKPAGAPVRLISSTHTDYNAQYSPDGRRIAFHSTRSGASEIWVADAEGAKAVRLTNFNAPITGSPRWSPDGRWIVFDSNKEGQFEVYRIAASGGVPVRLTEDAATDGVPSYSRDGRSIYFLSNRGGSNQIWKMDTDGKHVRQITRHGGYLGFESFDGQWLYYSHADGDSPLDRVAVEGGAETEVLPRVYEFGFCVTRGGILFAGGQNSHGIEFLDFQTGKVTSFFRPEKQMTVGMSLSPDERHLLFPQRESSGSDLMLVENFPEHP